MINYWLNKKKKCVNETSAVMAFLMSIEAPHYVVYENMTFEYTRERGILICGYATGWGEKLHEEFKPSRDEVYFVKK